MLIAYTAIKECCKAMVELAHGYGTQRVNSVNLKSNISDYFYLNTLTSIMKQEKYLLACAILSWKIIQCSLNNNQTFFVIALFHHIVCLLYAKYSKWLVSHLFEYLLSVSHMLLHFLDWRPSVQTPRHGWPVPEFWASVMFSFSYGKNQTM